MDLSNPPPKYRHCRVKLAGTKTYSVVNDLTFDRLERTIIAPWNSSRPFTVAGAVIRGPGDVSEIRIEHTNHPKDHYAQEHNARMRSSSVADMATDRRLLPFSRGTDATFDLLFSGQSQQPTEPDVEIIKRVCRRLPQAARILAVRSRKGKVPFEITDEYDVQDLLHTVLRAYVKHSVQENPLPKVAGAKSARADISIDELGILIEIKFVRAPEDQKRIFEEFSQDLVLYSQWPHLKFLLMLIYNSKGLRDAEAFEKLSSTQEVGGRRFEVEVILA
jgi:hypothetical protein